MEPNLSLFTQNVPASRCVTQGQRCLNPLEVTPSTAKGDLMSLLCLIWR